MEHHGLNYITPQGQAYGGVAQLLLENKYDPGAMRPFVGKRGLSYVEVAVRNSDGTPVINRHTGRPATQVVRAQHNATLRKDEWIELDSRVRDVAYPQLRFYSDLRSMVPAKNLVGGIANILLQTQQMGDISGAQIGMSPVRKSERDLLEFTTVTTPLPIIYKHFFIDGRELEASRRRGEGLNTITARKMARKCAEEVEDRATGVAASFSYGGGTLYGLTNYTNRNTVVITAPTAVGWTGDTLLGEVLDMVQAAQDDDFDGPFVLYYSRSWSRYLGEDFSPAKGQNTVLQRLEATPEIGAGNVRRLNRLTGYQLVLVAMQEDVVRPIVGMEIQTVQYPYTDPFVFEFGVMCMLLTEFQSSPDGDTGVVHGNTA